MDDNLKQNISRRKSKTKRNTEHKSVNIKKNGNIIGQIIKYRYQISKRKRDKLTQI
jgi:hypothetical protein